LIISDDWFIEIKNPYRAPVRHICRTALHYPESPGNTTGIDYINTEFADHGNPWVTGKSDDNRISGEEMAVKKSSQTNEVGKKIKKARTAKGFTLENIANETGFTIEHLKSIESGKKIPSVGSLLQISKVLGIDSGFLLKSEGTALKNRIQAYTKRTDNYAYETLTPGAESKHLKAFRVTIDPMQEHQGVGYCHEGEEYVYVLSGEIELIVGDHKNLLIKDDSLHFNSGIKHQMKNIGKKAANLLVVVYGP